MIEISEPERLPPVPLVSVLMITFNHQDYIGEAIESVVSQKCDFPFELLIGEDASRDGTLAVAREYQQRFPQTVRLITGESNVGMIENCNRLLRASKGHYLAYCEGDDYWCDDRKLAKQVELISEGPHVGAVHSDWVRAKFEGGAWQVDWNKTVHRRVPSTLLQGRLFRTFHFPKVLRTCTLMIRREVAEQVADSPLGRKQYKFLDAVYAAYVCSRYAVAHVPDVTAVYRESPNSALRSGVEARIAFLQSSLEFDSDARRFFGMKSGYPAAYRWELGVGLFLWAITGGRMEIAASALADLRKHFSLFGFVRSGFQALALRRPALVPARKLGRKTGGPRVGSRT